METLATRLGSKNNGNIITNHMCRFTSSNAYVMT